MKETTTVYTYKVIKEDFNTGERAKQYTLHFSKHPLEVGKLYMYLPNIRRGSYRIIELLKTEKYSY